MLPFLDGWQIISALRESGHEEPVLFLTAKDNVRDKVKGLELGADDYLIKPFDFTELVARVRTLLRRARSQAATVCTIADMTGEMDLLPRTDHGPAHHINGHIGDGADCCGLRACPAQYLAAGCRDAGTG